MDFYESIADHYDDIFPLDEAQVGFVKGVFPPPYTGREALDVGCGTGNLAVALAHEGFRITGIDLDAAMAERAAEKGRGLPRLDFRQMDMRNLSREFRLSSFDGVLCFGNTLVHIEKRRDIFSFFQGARGLLREGGRLLLQILNYDHILANHLPGLPTIENDRVRFERIYRYADTGPIVFKTVLTVKASRSVLVNEVLLYPLRKDEIGTLLKEADFAETRFYGDFRRGPLLPESLPLVVEAWG
jgi:glycine/sarcosine N-methyltransferase